MKHCFLFFLTAFCVLTCKTQDALQELNVVPLSETNDLILLDSTAAAQAIVKDEMEHFFDLINRVDMSIQMKQNFSDSISRKGIVEKYKAFLQNETLSFKAEEAKFVEEVFTEIYEACNKISPNLFPKEIKLIKIQGNHYGPLAYYTRENCIVIPSFALSARNKESFQSTMIHEVFHIYSRINPEKKKALYGLIGFKKVNRKFLKMNDSLQQRILLNPDGIDYAYMIKLEKENGKKVYALPIITSNQFGYTGNKPNFFNYLEFHLYETNPPISKYIKVLAQNDGSPLEDLVKNRDFHRQIRDNTGYIIHPDEIMADNFMFLITKYLKGEYPRKFSEEGLSLLEQIEAVVKK